VSRIWRAAYDRQYGAMADRKRGRAGQVDRARRMARTKGLCERCGCMGRWKDRKDKRVTLAKVVNHIVPLAMGGPDTDENCENLCKPCDLIVTAEQFGHRQTTAIGDDGWPIT
jgi:5-methylcytosine-specific restriction protein A